jgi:hypothetical protein
MTAKVSDRRLRELLLYVARKTENDPSCGRTKLYKILFYADFTAYQKLGESISGQEYQRLPNGPAPKRALPVQKSMQKEEVARWADRDYYGRMQKKLLALREPDLSGFSGEQIAILDDVIQKLWGLSAADVSELSHRFIGWQLAEEGETIPYSTVALGEPRPPTPKEIAYGWQLVRATSV